MNKEQANKRIKAIEEELKQLKSIVNKPDEPKYGDIKDRIKTIEDIPETVFNRNGLDKRESLGKYYNVLNDPQDWVNPEFTLVEISNTLIMLIIEVLNEGWKPNWDNSNEYKYYPWFKCSSNLSFSYYVCDFGFSSSHVGSRKVLKSKELAEYVGKQFIDLYKHL